MAGPHKTSERSVALFLLGALAFSPPLLFIFSAERSILGVPLLFLYLFAAWIIVIVLIGVLAGRVRLGGRERIPTTEQTSWRQRHRDA
ncbi:MAG: hypothetical protein O7I42_17350 [Alphaproteobacteria bacterium]|nr:hypothetical protein [Alphaproteobacteria bacterium]